MMFGILKLDFFKLSEIHYPFFTKQIEKDVGIDIV